MFIFYLFIFENQSIGICNSNILSSLSFVLETSREGSSICCHTLTPKQKEACGHPDRRLDGGFTDSAMVQPSCCTAMRMTIFDF